MDDMYSNLSASHYWHHLPPGRCRMAAESLIEFERDVFIARSRYLVLFITLTYKKEWLPMMTLEHLQRDRDNLFNNMRNNKLLRGIQEIAWRIEEGRCGGGMHLHCVIFYDGQSTDDRTITKAIGEYWEMVITNKCGAYRNSNADSSRHEYGPFGVITGPVSCDNHAKRHELRRFLVDYISKDNQLVEVDARYRMFGTSNPQRRPFAG